MTDTMAAAAIPLDDDGLTIGMIPVPGVGLRVGIMCMGTLITLSPKKARIFAKKFKSKEAIAANMGWVHDDLIALADQIDAMPKAEQLRRVNAVIATMQSEGSA